MNKRRYVDKTIDFDMDLTYICDRVIAMAVPSVGGCLHRNDISQVQRFFATRHYGHFLIFNLCEADEEGGNGNYDPTLLYGQVCDARPCYLNAVECCHVVFAILKLWC